ncbi:hypothetical protein PLANPX_4112 [Lacipirellula parvula]|uniref:Uncharacterized protein n=2 Tax=Lacipirellula parvula TaxID=2650471 RepID=A0A5K7XCE4_9BACT|nr:hypothetical protein PLANPX_4112 [Lacipirellula parvula]
MGRLVKAGERVRIAVDMDEVIADSHGRHVELYRRDFGVHLAEEQLLGRRFSEAVHEDHRLAVKQYAHELDFFSSLSVIPDSQDVLARLYERHDVFIASAAMEFPTSFVPKFEWLREYFPFFSWENVVFCGDKSIIAADYLIDDIPRNLERFGGEGILFSAPHNRKETRFRRVQGWAEIAELFLD